MKLKSMSELARFILVRSVFGDLIGRLPFVRDLYARHVWRKKMNQFFGVYRSFEEALAAAERFTAVGWNEPGIAGVLVSAAPFDPAASASWDGTQLFQPCHYAAMFWMGRRIRPDSQIVDLGGAGGISYEIHTRYSDLPPGTRWHVVDLPELVERGKLRHANTATALTFGSRLADAPACDILHTAGCLQYMENPFGFTNGTGILEQMAAMPTDIIVNKIPLTNGRSFTTIQNLLQSASPYNVFNRADVLAYFRKHGYQLIDEWRVSEISVAIPFHSELYIPESRGLYWRREHA
jgi:putative methyltransferase (TIGR04325 family)